MIIIRAGSEGEDVGRVLAAIKQLVLAGDQDVQVDFQDDEDDDENDDDENMMMMFRMMVKFFMLTRTIMI